MTSWFAGAARLRWSLLFLYYVAAAGFEIWMRPAVALPVVVSWAVFLGTGPALAAALLGGAGAWIPTFFGVFVAQALVHGTTNHPNGAEMMVVQGDLIVAAIAAIQSELGARLVRARFGLPIRLHRRREIAVLLLLSGPVVAVALLLAAYVAGLIDHLQPNFDMLATLLIGWLAGVASVYIFVPLALLHPWRGRSLIFWRGAALPQFSPRALFYVVLSLALSGGSWTLANELLARHNRQQFAALADDGLAALRGRLGTYEFGLEAATALMRASDQVTDGDWRRFIGVLRSRGHLPGVATMGFARLVPPGRMQEYLDEVHDQGDPAYGPFPAEPVAPGPRALIRLVAPESERPELAGMDFAALPAVAQAAARAGRSGDTILSARLPADGEARLGLGPGFVLLHPVYAPGVPLLTAADREGALVGYTFLTFTARGLAEGLTRGMVLTLADDGPLADAGASVDGGEVTTDPAPLSHRPFYSSAVGETGAMAGHAYRVSWRVPLQGRVWTVSWGSTPEYERGLHRLSPALVLIAGLAFTLLLATFLLSTARREELIRETVARKTREIAQRETENRSILDTALVMIALLDDGGRILTANDAIGRLFGYHREDLAGMKLTDLLAGETAEYFTRSDDPHDVTGFRGIVHMTARSGARLALDIQIRPWLTEERQRRYTVVMRNVAERLRIEAQLRDTQHRLDVALKGAEIGVFDVDLVTGESIVSDTWRDLMGFDRDAAIETQMEWRDRIHPDDRAAVEAADGACIAGESETSVCDYRLQTATGDWRWMRSHAVASERDASGRALRLIGVQMDVTEERRLDQAKSEFVSTVSHELRTPLTSINGSISLVLNTTPAGELPERVLRLLTIAQKNCDRLIPLVNDILDLEKVAAGQIRFAFTEEDVKALLTRAIADNKPYADQFGVRLRLIAPADLPRGRLDVNRFMQVMANLLSNASKFSERNGSVEVRLGRTGAALRVSVTDHGSGIPPAFHERIFRPFSQADSSATREKGGTGLGLNISKQIVERMGGTIGFRSDPGRETVFWFTLPVAGDAEGQNGGAGNGGPAAVAEGGGVTDPAMSTLSLPGQTGGAARGQGPSLVYGPAAGPAAMPPRRPLILHVEDDHDFAEIVAASFGAQADIVHADRHFSLDALRARRRYDLVLLESAQADGSDALLIDAVARLQPGVPMIALTASDKADSDPRIACTIIKTRTRFEEIVSICLETLGGGASGGAAEGAAESGDPGGARTAGEGEAGAEGGQRRPGAAGTGWR
ncbi:ATP-binding protein [Acidimangrovimonas sediminis]|uniref:ATP-binding protein n=1 Tax=Acidimangrovimonas sediminis TaxID=2056283 RepID=UPI000C801D35|nr:ATP-binding protein [Acidimangrovimonas sediminis]